MSTQPPHFFRVEMETHEPKEIFHLYSASYPSLKNHVQWKVQRTLQSQYQELMHCKSMKNAENLQIQTSRVWRIADFCSNFASAFRVGWMPKERFWKPWPTTRHQLSLNVIKWKKWLPQWNCCQCSYRDFKEVTAYRKIGKGYLHPLWPRWFGENLQSHQEDTF